MAGYSSIHALHHDRYTKGGGIRDEAEYLDRSARMMLSKTKIVPNLERAIVLMDLFEGLPPASDAKTQQRIFDVFGLLTDCYEPIADDVLILSAFEIHAKAELLRRGYVIHEIREPKELAKKQKKSPIHVRTIRALVRRGTNPLFKDTTIGITILNVPAYLRHYRLPSGAAEKALEEVWKRRNLVHFGEPFVWGVDRALISFVDHLNRAVPPIVVKQRRRRRV